MSVLSQSTSYRIKDVMIYVTTVLGISTIQVKICYLLVNFTPAYRLNDIKILLFQ